VIRTSLIAKTVDHHRKCERQRPLVKCRRQQVRVSIRVRIAVRDWGLGLKLGSVLQCFDAVGCVGGRASGL